MAVARFTGWGSIAPSLPGLRAARSKLGFKLAPAFAGCEVQLRRRFLTPSITE